MKNNYNFGCIKLHLKFNSFPTRFVFWEGMRLIMDTRVAIIGIILEKKDNVEKLNSILHDYSKWIIGRMGMPYPKKSINIINIMIDAPQDEINTLLGKIGKLSGITSKVMYSNI